MKRTVSIVLLMTLLCCLLASCGNNTPSAPTQVQKITYPNGTLTSKYYFEYTAEEVSAEEYENAAEKYPYWFSEYLKGAIGVDDKVDNFFTKETDDKIPADQLQNYVGKSYYWGDGMRYTKITLTDLHLAYLNVKHISDSVFEVTYYDDTLKGDKTLRIKAEHYEIVYFSDIGEEA